MFKLNFNFGVKKAKLSTIIVLSLIIATLSSCLKIDEKNLWDLVYEYLKTYQSSSPLLSELRKNPDILKRHVERTVTSAIEQVTPEYNSIIEKFDRKYQPQYHEEPNDENVCYTQECKALSPPMRICSPWIDSCPKK